ncbi:hypothetical protein ACHAQJ_001184 [Trichoderma viride]
MVFVPMDSRITDQLINFAPSSPNMACQDIPGPNLVQHEQLGNNTDFVEPTGQCVTMSGPDPLDTPLDQSLITVPEANIGYTTNRTINNHVQNDALETYKKRAECLEMLQDIQGILRNQNQQLQLVLFGGKDLEYKLQNLPKEETETSLLLAVRSLSSSLVGVRHILKGNITMIEGMKSTSSLAKMRNSPRSSAQQTPVSQTSSNRADSAETDDDSSDLLLDCVHPDPDITAPTNLDTPNKQPFVTWNIKSPGADPFVDTPRKNVASFKTPPDSQPGLQFHSDFANLPGRKLYVASPVTSASVAEESRRVILKNLPPDAELPQIVRGIQCQGRIIGIIWLNTAPIIDNITKTVMLEFLHPRPAADFARATLSFPLVYEAKNGDQYRANAWLVPTASFALSWLDQEHIEQRRTRSLLLKGFPKDYIWYFICTIGVNTVAHVEYDEINDALFIELTTLSHANRVDRLIRHCKFSDFYRYCDQKGMFRTIAGDSSQANGNTTRPPRSMIKRLPQDDLKEYWNSYPYNCPPPHLQKSAAQQGPTRLTIQKRLALQYDIDEGEVEGFLHDLENHQYTEYRLVGSSITITRRKWGWRTKTEDETKLLMANTLHDPAWAEQWDEYFLARNEINIRTWEQYGRLAKHRREKAAEQGLGLGTVPKCGKRCELGCRDIKAAPVAAAVKEYLDTSKVKVIYTNES